MIRKLYYGMLFLGLSALIQAETTKTLKFAMVGKSNEAFFTQTLLGCQKAEAELEGVQCLFRLPLFSDVIEQDKVISSLIEEGVDGIAISVLQSRYLAANSLKKAKEKGIPVITFDSDLDASILNKYPGLRHAYVGTNNFEFGQQFALSIKQMLPEGGKICLLSGRPDTPNMMSRMKGLRAEFSGDVETRAPGHRLSKKSKWTEHRRCPVYNYEDAEIAMQQLSYLLKKEITSIDAFVSFGGWAQVTPGYRETLNTYKERIDDHSTIMLFADTLHMQMELLEAGLSSANIGQTPFEMGRQAIHTLYKITQKMDFPEYNYTPINVCTPATIKTCLKQNLQP